MRAGFRFFSCAVLAATAVALFGFARRPDAKRTCCDTAPSRAQLTTAMQSMVLIRGGSFWMGNDDPETPEAQPWHEVTVAPFFIDRTEVTNAEFERFVLATGYVTTAERAVDAARYPDAPADALVPAGIVFASPESPDRRNDPRAWWRLVPGASWRHPEGPETTIVGRERYPVVQVSWDDAVAYAKWARKRLPTEAEWEMAARGGLEKQRFTWGDELRPGGRWLANVWQGTFPTEDTAEDGFAGLAPVGSFPPNGFGLYDMAGNVWEWTADWYRTNELRVTKGGSFLCAEARCRGYQPGARGRAAPDSGTSHTGFRCVRSP